MANCLITGTLSKVNGSRIQGATVAWRSYRAGNDVQFIGSLAISNLEEKTTTDESGRFSISVPQGLEMSIKIDAIGLNRRVRVPEEVTATLEELLNADL